MGLLDYSDVLLDAEGPVDVDLVLVEGKQEDYEDKQGVEYSKGEDHVVAEFLQTPGKICLKVHANQIRTLREAFSPNIFASDWV